MKETILSLEKSAMERWRNGDPWGFVEISAEELTYVVPGLTAPILGLEDFKFATNDEMFTAMGY